MNPLDTAIARLIREQVAKDTSAPDDAVIAAVNLQLSSRVKALFDKLYAVRGPC